VRRLSYRQVLELVSGKPVDELILVGGQAINAWAEALGIADDHEEGLYGAAVSDDIDFLGLAPAAIKLADAIGGEVKVAGMDSHTPNAAVVTFDFDGETNTIDVLHSLQGFSEADLREVRKWAATPELPEALENKLRVMHPLHCLQAQLENVYGSLNRRERNDGERSANRLRMLCEITRRTIQRYLDENDIDSARTIIERLYALARTGPALRALATDGINLVTGHPRGEQLGADFLAKRLPQLERYLKDKLEKDERRRHNASTKS
jgi:hypothetical protein